jgi:hypothetical protein
MNDYPKIIAKFHKDGGLQLLKHYIMEKSLLQTYLFSYISHIEPGIGEVITLYANKEGAMKIADVEVTVASLMLEVDPEYIFEQEKYNIKKMLYKTTKRTYEPTAK